MGKIRVAVAGVGNCASSLVQGVEYYKNVDEKSERVPGLMHTVFGPYKISDIDFVAAFDVDKRKVGKPLNKAIFEKPNCTLVFQRDIPRWGNVIVQKGPVLDGIAEHMQDFPEERTFLVDEEQNPVNVVQVLKETKADILVNYMPVGSQKATEFYAQACLDAGVAMVNCMPVFIGSNPEWEKKFKKKGLPIIGDDVAAQIGATITHKALAKLFSDRGVKITGTYQLNVGGNSVTGDQEILLEINGQIRKFAIGQFIDEQILKYGCTSFSEKEILELENAGNLQIKCFTIDNDFRVITAPVTKLIRHKINENLYRVKFTDGREICITGDHNLFTISDDGLIKCVTVKELQPNESMVIAPATLEVYREALKEIDLRSHIEQSYVKIDGNYFSIHNHSEIKIPVRLPISTNLLEVVGLWLADGSYDRIGSSNIELAIGNDEECLELLNSVVGTFNISYKIKQNGVSVRISSKTLGAVFKKVLGLTGDCYTKRVPAWVYDLSNDQIAAVLRGYFSGDGGVVGRQIRCTSASKELIQDIQTLLLRIGIYPTIFMERTKKTGYKENAVFWHTIISSQENIQKFVSTISFIQSQKKHAAEKIANIRGFSRRFIPKIRLFSDNGIRPTTTYKVNKIEKRIVLSQLYKINDHITKNSIKKVCSDEIRFLTVRKIERLPEKEQYVYDLSVQPHERFICSNILVHNTDFLNMLARERLVSKKISKTEAVQMQLPEPLPDDLIHIGPSDYVPWLNDQKICFLRIEGEKFGRVPVNIELRLSVEDSPNSAGCVIDAIRACKLALDKGHAGAVLSVSAYLMKHPLLHLPVDQARQAMENFIATGQDTVPSKKTEKEIAAH